MSVLSAGCGGGGGMIGAAIDGGVGDLMNTI